MTAQDVRMVVWGCDYSIPDKMRAWREDLNKPAPSLVPKASRAPHAPDAWHLMRFWLAGPLTLLLFVPILMAGVFGAPTMVIGMYFGYRALRAGRDDYCTFAGIGLHAGITTLIIVIIFKPDFALLFAFGLLFGPFMAMCFRLIAGDWRGARVKSIKPAPAPPAATVPELARLPRTQ